MEFLFWEFGDRFWTIEPIIYSNLIGRLTSGSLWALASPFFLLFPPKSLQLSNDLVSELLDLICVIPRDTQMQCRHLSCKKLDSAFNTPLSAFSINRSLNFPQFSRPVQCLLQFPVLRILHPKVLRNACLLNVALFQPGKMVWAAQRAYLFCGSRKGKSRRGNTTPYCQVCLTKALGLQHDFPDLLLADLAWRINENCSGCLTIP